MDGKTAVSPLASMPLLEPIATIWARPLRRSRTAWGISCVVHSAVLITALWGGARVPETPPPLIRLVFAEPPPPPPAPSSAVAVETTASQPSVPSEAPRVEQPKPVVKPKEVERLKIVKKPTKVEAPIPRPHPPTETVPEPEPTPASSAAVASLSEAVSGATTAVANGVIGGASGGIAGGVIGAHGTEALPIDQVANPPLLLSRVMPEYPRQARFQGVEGLVLLEAILDLEGRIEDSIKVLHSIPSLDLAAIQAVRRWRFRPARDRESRPVRVILEVPVRFVLK